MRSVRKDYISEIRGDQVFPEEIVTKSETILDLDISKAKKSDLQFRKKFSLDFLLPEHRETD